VASSLKWWEGVFDGPNEAITTVVVLAPDLEAATEQVQEQAEFAGVGESGGWKLSEVVPVADGAE
jgi:hypothetical protein